MKGLELSELFYREYGRDMIADLFPEYENVIAVGVAGEGSDCFGYDDEISRDHDFEAGFCLWIPDRLEHELEFKLSRAYGRLPEEFYGVKRAKQSLWGRNRRGVILTGEFYSRFTGCPGAPKTLMEWLGTPEYSLACAVNGAVFRDDLGEFSAVRRELSAGYPEDVRLKKIAARAALMAQSGQYNFERCLRHGEAGAARMALHEFVQNGLSMVFLLNHRYMPYYKWAFRAARELPAYSEIAERMERLLLGDQAEGGRGARSPRADAASHEAERLSGLDEAAVLEQIETISGGIIEALRGQGLTDGSWDYLEPHAFEVMERIHDGTLRNLHVMEG